ncbi:YbaK/prolyl-tRNA synthetase associated region (plasmid) [Paracoccus denitrificans PD1222]|uniref:YbaK/prolyl-tRNA synthetase associated region n=1 Tax=Paracoccus denitrificans (strain Pd 1222) TaxID=318586 RepID=A1BB55_PARDP|nr:YbaK/prolyl-tRNA synthetase associated region [Paracoccus denitrificans PD1222]
MSGATPATQFLRRAQVAFRPVEYRYDPGSERVALQAAEAIGLPPGQLLKTLMVEVDGRPACAVLPGDRSLSMKRVAAAFGGDDACRQGAAADRLSYRRHQPFRPAPHSAGDLRGRGHGVRRGRDQRRPARAVAAAVAARCGGRAWRTGRGTVGLGGCWGLCGLALRRGGSGQKSVPANRSLC